jgi:nucleoside-diphosphate-sugar epimerase
MRKPSILITGANRQIGHGLITALHKKNTLNIITLDLNRLDGSIIELASEELTGNILDADLIDQLNGEYEFSTIYHLAALLSAGQSFRRDLPMM